MAAKVMSRWSVSSSDFEDFDVPSVTARSTRLEPAFETQLIAHFLERFFPLARLSASHTGEARSQIKLFSTSEPDGTLGLLLEASSGWFGTVEADWDGSAEFAFEIMEGFAENCAANIRWDQDNVGLTGWEPEFDLPEPHGGS